VWHRCMLNSLGMLEVLLLVGDLGVDDTCLCKAYLAEYSMLDDVLSEECESAYCMLENGE
jgi:hypothetical protein